MTQDASAPSGNYLSSILLKVVKKNYTSFTWIQTIKKSCMKTFSLHKVTRSKKKKKRIVKTKSYHRRHQDYSVCSGVVAEGKKSV